MDLKNFRQMRYLRIVSHNGNSSAPDGQPSASNFNVVIGDDIARVGELTAFALDNITFPNLFPNITQGNNIITYRTTPPNGDDYHFPVSSLNYYTQDGQLVDITIEPSLGPFNTVDQMAYVSVQPGIQGVFDITVDPYGAIIMKSLIGPVKLNGPSDNWTFAFGFPPEQLGGYQTTWIGYPLEATNPPFNQPVFFQIQVPVGFYDQDSLVGVLADLLHVNDPLFNVSIMTQGTNSYFDISNPVTQFELVPMYKPSDLSGIEPNYRQLVYQLGFQNLPSDLYNTIIALLNPALQGEQIVYLHSIIMSSSRKSYSGEGAPDSVIAAIPVNAPYGAIVVYSLNQWADPAFVYERGIAPREFDFTLRNQYNENLDIGWNQTLTLFFRMFFDWRQDV